MTREALLATLFGAAAIAACGDDGHGGPHDAPLGDGPCGADLYFTGEVVDWDETATNFCGVFNATMQVAGDATRVDHTNPNGRFEMCIARAATTRIDITPPSAMSQCVAGGMYQIPGIAVANKDVIATGKLFSARMITAARLMPFFSGFGVTYDASKATVVVHVEGVGHPVDVSGAHDTALGFDGTTWSATTGGTDVVFPNIDPASGTATVTSVGGGTGLGAVPIAAGTFTYVTVVGLPTT